MYQAARSTSMMSRREALLALCNDSARYFKSQQCDGLHPGQSAIFVDGQQVGFVGAVHPQLQKQLVLTVQPMS